MMLQNGGGVVKGSSNLLIWTCLRCFCTFCQRHPVNGLQNVGVFGMWSPVLFHVVLCFASIFSKLKFFVVFTLIQGPGENYWLLFSKDIQVLKTSEKIFGSQPKKGLLVRIYLRHSNSSWGLVFWICFWGFTYLLRRCYGYLVIVSWVILLMKKCTSWYGTIIYMFFYIPGGLPDFFHQPYHHPGKWWKFASWNHPTYFVRGNIARYLGGATRKGKGCRFRKALHKMGLL